MEVYNPTQIDYSRYATLINQNGNGTDIDRYIYSDQHGEGIGSLFGNLIRSAVPIFRQGIKGAAKLAKPHLQKAAKDIVTTGSKRLLDSLANHHQLHKTSKKSRKNSTKQRKWQGL